MSTTALALRYVRMPRNGLKRGEARGVYRPQQCLGTIVARQAVIGIRLSALAALQDALAGMRRYSFHRRVPFDLPPFILPPSRGHCNLKRMGRFDYPRYS